VSTLVSNLMKYPKMEVQNKHFVPDNAVVCPNQMHGP
jgi:hypothetical protein